MVSRSPRWTKATRAKMLQKDIEKKTRARNKQNELGKSLIPFMTKEQDIVDEVVIRAYKYADSWVNRCAKKQWEKAEIVSRSNLFNALDRLENFRKGFPWDE